MAKAPTAEEAVELNPEFTFDLSGDPYTEFLDEHLDVQDLVKKGSKPVCCSLVMYIGVVAYSDFGLGPHLGGRHYSTEKASRD